MNLNQLENTIDKNLDYIYALCGNENVLRKEAIKLTTRKAQKEGYIAREVYRPENKEAHDDLYPLLNCQSLLAEKKIIELDFRYITPNKLTTDIIQDYLHKPRCDLILIISLAKADAQLKRSKWFQTLNKKSKLIHLYPPFAKDLPNWITKRAARYQLQFTPDALSTLIALTENNLTAIVEGLEKLYLFNAQEKITANLIHDVLSEECQYSIYDLSESLLQCHSAQALKVLHYLIKNGTELPLILWTITKELRLILQAQDLLAQNITFEAIFKELQIFPQRQYLFKQFLQKKGKIDCAALLESCLYIDHMIKGAIGYNVHAALEILILKICQ